MKAALYVLGFLGAGLVGAAAARYLPAGGAESPVATEAPSALESRVAELEARMDDLRQELREVRSAPPLAEEAPAIAPVAAPDADIDVPVAPPLSADVTEEVIEEKVREVIEERTRVAREEMARKKEATQVEKETAWLKKLQPELDLTDQQVEDLLGLLKKRRVFATAYRKRWDEETTPEGREALKQEAADFGRTLDADLRSLVSATQYDGIIQAAREYRKGKR